MPPFVQPTCIIVQVVYLVLCDTPKSLSITSLYNVPTGIQEDREASCLVSNSRHH